MLHYLQNYRRQLDDLRRIAGAVNESNLSKAFAGLLEDCGRDHKLILVPEWTFRGRDGTMLRADGVLLDRLRLVHGWWEAKDSRDHLDREIEAKLRKGYPSDNILFEDTVQAVLLQNGREARRVSLANDAALTGLLEQFFAFRPPEVEQFEQAAAQFRRDLPEVIAGLSVLIGQRETDSPDFCARLADFHALCGRAIGARVTPGHVREMLIQHVLTEQIFRDLFPASAFHQENHLARALSGVEQAFLRGETRPNLLRRMEPYYAAIRRAAANAIAAPEKQDFLKAVYEDFYTAYNPKDADRMGIVYTPTDVVRFIVQGCDTLARAHFGRGLADAGMDILDPCTGTGTFIVELLEFLRGDRTALARKYAGEIHANEIAILPYYIAGLNIEQMYADIMEDWREFTGACFVDTLENWGFAKTYSGAQGDLIGSITDENQQRIREQNARRIPVIIGNPPYNANQQNENDNNKNVIAQKADQRIKETYLAASNAQKTKLYDPYVRFLRWASDRIGEEGIIGFVTNRSYLDARGFDGFRKVVAQEFQEIWIIDLQSDVRRNPKISGTKHNVFGIQTGVAIVFLIRNPRCNGCQVHYLAVDDFLTAIEKKRFLSANSLAELKKQGAFQRVLPNAAGDWLNLPFNDWSSQLALVDKEVKQGHSNQSIFSLFSLGVVTNRDDWVYDSDYLSLEKKIKFLIDNYNSEIEFRKATNKIKPLCKDIKWTRAVKKDLERNLVYSYFQAHIIHSFYRPFFKVFLYFDKKLNEMQYQLPAIFGDSGQLKNQAIVVTNKTSDKPFGVFITTIPPDLHFLGDTLVLPLNCYAKNGSATDNITNWSLAQFQDHYPDGSITKLDIFHYIYAVLHDPVYRETYALNLKREFPRIPFYPDFRQWATWGEQLMALHLGYETIEPWPLRRVQKTPSPPAPLPQAGEGRVKVRLKADKIAGRIEIDDRTALEEIPPEAWDYRLGHRSALEWILEEYKEKTPRDPTIREQFNTYRFADYKETVIDLLLKVCWVSVATQQIIGAMRQYPRSAS